MRLALVVILASAAVLASCKTQEERLNELMEADAVACKAMSQIPYETCLQQRMQYRVLGAQMQATQGAGMGPAMQNAGAALQSINPPVAAPPPMMQRPIQCNRIGNTMQCF